MEGGEEVQGETSPKATQAQEVLLCGDPSTLSTLSRQKEATFSKSTMPIEFRFCVIKCE